MIVPAWNEAASVGSTVREISFHCPDYTVVVVDDGSRDGTGDAARDAGATVLTLPFNLGVGGAMRVGFRYAYRHGYTRAIQVDADGQHNPEDIDRVLAGLDIADISIGARFADVGDYAVRGPRRWAMRLLAVVVSRTAHTRLTDVTSGFRAANERAMVQYLKYYPAEYLGDTIDSLIAAVHSGLTVTQVPVVMRRRIAGRPSQRWLSASAYLARCTFALTLALIRDPRIRTDVSA